MEPGVLREDHVKNSNRGRQSSAMQLQAKEGPAFTVQQSSQVATALVVITRNRRTTHPTELSQPTDCEK